MGSERGREPVAVRHRSLRRRFRSTRGGVIVEGVVSLWMLVTASVLLLLLLINVGRLLLVMEKLDFIACEVAKEIDAEKYWLGTVRLDYKDDPTGWTELANTMLQTLALDKTNGVDVQQGFSTSSTIGGRKIQITRVKITICGLSTLGFPLTGSGVASDHAVPPYAQMMLTIAQPPGDPISVRPSNGLDKKATAKGECVILPAYGAVDWTYGGGYVANPNAAPGSLTGPTRALFHFAYGPNFYNGSGAPGPGIQPQIELNYHEPPYDSVAW